MPEDGLEVTVSIWAMHSLHSDWHREVNVVYRGSRISKRLFEDTGWWRGSNLYRHTSGAYVIHEGQNGCFSFTVDPLEFADTPSGVCEKSETTDQIGDGSRYYPELTYLGQFHETYRDEDGIRLRFLAPQDMPEVELPDPL